MNESFVFYFRRRRQSIKVFLWDVHPNTFANWKAGRWGYFLATWKSPRLGTFGELHFVKSRLRIDTVVHELQHVIIEWMWANRTAITGKNEEYLCTFMDELVRNFIKNLRMVYKINEEFYSFVGRKNKKQA